MSDYDRGAYTPQSDAPLAFDARQSRGGGGGGGGPSPMTLIISGVVLLLLVIALLIFYRSGVRRGDEAPQVVGSPLTQTKAAPPASAQPVDPGAGLQVYKTEVAPPSEGKAPPTFVATPEQPAARPAPAQRETTPAVASVEPPASSAPHLRTAQAETPQAVPAAPAKTAPAKVAKATPAPASTAAVAGGAMVQIGAFSSAALADKGWNDTAGLMPGAMAGKTKKVEFITKNDQPFYRTYVGGFASKIEAQTFCSALKAAGKSCFVK
jgi:cell division protein FtsN